GDRGTHDVGVSSMKSTGNIRRSDKRIDALILTELVNSKTLAKIAIDVNTIHCRNPQRISPAPCFERECVKKFSFLLPSLVRRGLGGGRKSRWTNPLESPLTKRDTREGAANFLQLQGIVRPDFHVLSFSA